GEARSPAETARSLGLSREQARRIEGRALDRLRRQAGGRGLHAAA
nr:RNA polymerase subunit sigma-70 [Thermoleophilaceae bacterium]